MGLKSWVVRNRKTFKGADLDFVEDLIGDKRFREPKNWADLKFYLRLHRAPKEAIEAGKRVFTRWQKEDVKAKIDGLGPNDLKNIHKAVRQVWSWSHPRKLVIQRCTDTDGFLHCEKCRKRVPKISVDHIDPVGEIGGRDYIQKMWCPSSRLQGLCKKCHDKKTKEENIKDFY